MTRTPIGPISAKSTHRVHRSTVRRSRDSPRRSSNLFRTRRDSLDFSNHGRENDEDDDPHAMYASPAKRSRRNSPPHNSPRRHSYSWDDETTLFSELLHDNPGNYRVDPTAKYSALADSLQVPFTAAAHTLQPAVQSVIDAHDALKKRVDPMFATGLLSFDDACKALEALSIDENRALQHAFTATETRIKDLFARLEDAYRDRDRLWANLEAMLTSNVDPALAALAEVPAATERTIAALEKHAKNLVAKDDDGAEKLRGVLAKFT
ncbi:hypothetical protein B0H14DRAFT_3122309 [Mycena olivaceomarginata]|nr:hypothetical protein B0H14DRAFT_3122309 [Mycena olivaceomarginata]